MEPGLEVVTLAHEVFTQAVGPAAAVSPGLLLEPGDRQEKLRAAANPVAVLADYGGVDGSGLG